MSLQCPKCQSEKIDIKNTAKKAGGAVGTIGGLVVGGIAGGTAGAALGEVVDENILDNYFCLSCEYAFSLHRPIFD